jgi:ATP-dependent DNA helicase RecG
MPSALETLVKILKLEQDMSYQDKAVIGGLRSFAVHWSQDAHAQAKKPEHHVLVDEITALLNTYGDLPATSDRHNTIKHIIGRITGRIPAGTAPGEPARPVEKEPARPPAIKPTPPSTPRPASPVEARKPVTEPPSREVDFELGPVAVRQAEPVTPDVTEPARMARPPRRKRSAPADSATLRASIDTISGVGPKMGATLAQLGIQSIEDWLYFFPRRYDDYSRMLPLNALQPGMDVTVIGTVRQSTMIKGQRGLDVLMVTIDDGTNTLTAYFFGQPYLRSKLERGVQVVFSGKTDIYRGRLKMDNPEWEFLETEALHTRSIIPIYPLTKGLSAHAPLESARD